MNNKDTLIRIFSLAVALVTSLIVFNPRDGRQHALVWIPKLIVAAFSPLLALLGGISALAGLLRKDPLSLGLGLFSMMVGTEHIARATAPREGFEKAFGRDWEWRIPLSVQAKFAPQRWQPFLSKRHPGILHHDVVYGINAETGRPLLADIMQPPPGVKRTGLAMMYIHGGAWIYGRKNIHKLPVFRRLALQGHVVVDIDYVKAPHTTVLSMVRDIKRAILWLKQNAGAYGIDPERIVLMGQSAGAEMALLCAYAPHHPTLQPPENDGDASIRAVVSSYGPTDMFALHDDIETRFGHLSSTSLGKTVQSILEKLGYQGDTLSKGISAVVGSTPEENPELYRLLSPIYHVNPEATPTLFLQGTHDIFLDHRQVKKMYKKLRQNGVPTVYLSFDHCDHAFDTVLPRISPSSQTASYYLERFLALMV
jgi:acetyl esterase/lipase